jgi:hypothetical protein
MCRLLSAFPQFALSSKKFNRRQRANYGKRNFRTSDWLRLLFSLCFSYSHYIFLILTNFRLEKDDLKNKTLFFIVFSRNSATKLYRQPCSITDNLILISDYLNPLEQKQSRLPFLNMSQSQSFIGSKTIKSKSTLSLPLRFSATMVYFPASQNCKKARKM